MKTYKKVQMWVHGFLTSPPRALIDQPHAPATLTAEKALPVTISFKEHIFISSRLNYTKFRYVNLNPCSRVLLTS